MKNLIVLSLLLLAIVGTLRSQTPNMQPVASVSFQNQSTTSIDWLVTDSTRYWYYPDGEYLKTEAYCKDNTSRYYLCSRVDYYISPDTSITTFYEYNPSSSALEQNSCYFNRTDSQGRTVERGGCYNPSGNNFGYDRLYYTYDTLGRMKQFRHAAWSNILQRLINSEITDYFFDTLGYKQYYYSQVNSGGSWYLNHIVWDSLDLATNTTYTTAISKMGPTSNWDTSRHIITTKDTVAGVITTLTILQGINTAGSFGNIRKDSLVFDESNLISEQYWYNWNDTVQLWQPSSSNYSQRDSSGRLLSYEQAYAIYTGAPIYVTNRGTNTYDSLGRIVNQLHYGFDYQTGTQHYVEERNTEYDVPMGDSTATVLTTIYEDKVNNYITTSKNETYFDSLTRQVEYRYSIFDTLAQSWQPRYWGYYYYDESLLLNGTEDLHVAMQQLVLAPNPTSGTSTLTFEATAPSQGQLTIHDITGKQVMAQNIQVAPGNSQVTLNLKALGISASGIYLINLTTPEATYTGKLLYQP